MMNRDLKATADLIRYYTLKELGRLGYGHYGGALSIVEVLAVLYGSEMKFDSNNPESEDRDYFILSKGHAGPAYYAALAVSGFFPIDNLFTLNDNGTDLPSHPDRNKIKGVDMTTGSLGQGISVAAGLAYYLKYKNMTNRVYCIVGDGELNEGQCWEAFMFIAHHNLNNLVVIIDDNKKQLDGYTKDICNLFSLEDKFRAFGFNVEKLNGNDIESIKSGFDSARKIKDKPTSIILDTVKGAGVKFIEDTMSNHHMRLDKEATGKINETILDLEKSLQERGLL
ncbi:transketolase [Peptostreptococcus canis]|uniref:Transketolase n=2 Tax=Peptostreptococcus canis TaxID=1159213 RepID=A0ABR6TNX5_9FIRM|nr:transketolase [Peptostreptococcus canis]